MLRSTRTEPGDAAARATSSEIREAAERAAALTRQLLAFSRRQVLQPKLLDLNASVGELEPACCAALIGEDVVLTTQLDARRSAPSQADPGQLEQVLMNLVVNARDAMPGGGTHRDRDRRTPSVADDAAPRIEAGALRDADGARHRHGMDAETLAQIFEPFFTTKEPARAPASGSRRCTGSSSRAAATSPSSSEPDEGTTFTVYLRRDAEARVPRIEPVPDDAAPQPPTHPAAETVLLVEDEEVVRRLVRQVLENDGYRVLEAHDGEVALELARSTPRWTCSSPTW